MEDQTARNPVTLRRPPGLAETVHEYGQRWEIEHMDHRIEWVAVQRETSGDYICIVGANNLGDLQHKMKQIERDKQGQHAVDDMPQRKTADMRSRQ
jgi:hypothetical protein